MVIFIFNDGVRIMNDMVKYARMNFEELLEKCQTLLAENKDLKEELKNLKERFGISEKQTVPEQNTDVSPLDSGCLVGRIGGQA